MARKTKTGQSAAARRKFVSDVAKLRKAGLISKAIDPRSQRPTDYMKRQVRKYRDVIEGSAQSVKIRASKGKTVAQVRSEFREFKSKGDRIVVPVAVKRGRVTYSKKGGLGTTRDRAGQKYRVIVLPKSDRTNEGLRKYQGNGNVFAIVFGSSAGARTYYFESFDELEALMNEYEPPKGSYKGWRDYVEILKPVRKAGLSDFESEDDEG